MFFEKNVSVHASLWLIFQHFQMHTLFQFISGAKCCIFTTEYYAFAALSSKSLDKRKQKLKSFNSGRISIEKVPYKEMFPVILCDDIFVLLPVKFKTGCKYEQREGEV